jgi:hypothetical protein
MIVRQLTIEQKDFLIGKKWDLEQYFNPIQDANDNWIISNAEATGCNTIEWVKDLPLIEYKPIINELF